MYEIDGKSIQFDVQFPLVFSALLLCAFFLLSRVDVVYNVSVLIWFSFPLYLLVVRVLLHFELISIFSFSF